MAGLKLVFKKLILEMKKLKKWTAEKNECAEPKANG
jgi:hypothetical protein